MSLLAVSVVLLWAIVIVLVLLVTLLYRQFGLLYLGSGGAVRLRGREVGRRAPDDIILSESAGQDFAVTWDDVGQGRCTILLLTGESCPLCEALVPELNDFTRMWADVADVVVADRAESSDLPTRPLPDPRDWRYGRSIGGACHKAFDIDIQPYAFLIDWQGIIRARDIVNATPQREALLRSILGDDRRVMASGFRSPVELTPNPGRLAARDDTVGVTGSSWDEG